MSNHRKKQVNSDRLTGAQSLLETLINCGVEACFANPGTSELSLVAALQNETRLRSILCLFEGVATGAADGFGRMRGKPAATLLHLGPGLANGWANLHNAQKAKTPVINLIGENPSWHIPLGAALDSNLIGLSESISDWTKIVSKSTDVGASAAEAFMVATSNGGQIASLVLPGEVTWEKDGVAAQPMGTQPLEIAPSREIETVANVINSGSRVAFLTTGASLIGRGREACTRIAAKTGAQFFCKPLNSRIERGVGRMKFTNVSAWGESTLDMLSEFDDLILVGAGVPVLAFGHPEYKSVLVPESVNVTHLATPEQDVAGTLVALSDALGAPTLSELESVHCKASPTALATGNLTPEAIGLAVNKYLPEGAIISDESGVSSTKHYPLTAGAAPHDCLFLTGGSIGQGLPVALGAAIACPNQKILCLQADGGGMYTLQALWSMARENCDVTTVIFSNRVYGILIRSLGQYGITDIPNSVPDLFDLSNPDLNWAKLAEGMGVESHICDTADNFNNVFQDCISRRGPHLIEAVI